MHSDEYQRLSAACRAMAAQSADLDKVRWSILAKCSSDLADEVAATRLIDVGYPRIGPRGRAAATADTPGRPLVRRKTLRTPEAMCSGRP